MEPPLITHDIREQHERTFMCIYALMIFIGVIVTILLSNAVYLLQEQLLGDSVTHWWIAVAVAIIAFIVCGMILTSLLNWITYYKHSTAVYKTHSPASISQRQLRAQVRAHHRDMLNRRGVTEVAGVPLPFVSNTVLNAPGQAMPNGAGLALPPSYSHSVIHRARSKSHYYPS
jgi:uncharacterized membrane protein (DUF485 family)